MIRLGTALAHTITLALAIMLTDCATGGGEREGGERVYTDWESLLRAEIPRAEVRGNCVLSLGRGEEQPPVIEVDGQRFYDGCIPSYLRPENVARIDALSVSEASTILGSRGANGMLRIRTKQASR